MKSLFITFQDVSKKESGIGKKVCSQHEAFKLCGMDMELASYSSIDQTTYLQFSNGERFKIGKNDRLKLFVGKQYKYLLNYILTNQVKFIYIRYIYIASPSFIWFIKQVKQAGAKIYLEIPTYPYDQESKKDTIAKKIYYKIENYYRNCLYKYIDKIVTFSDDDIIFNTPTVRISNAIDFNIIKLREKKPKHDYIKFTAVAGITYWHGYDRIITALSSYYSKYPNSKRVYLDFVGDGSDLSNLKLLCKELGVEEFVAFYGFMSGEELDAVLDDTDICIGSLGRYRNGITQMKALKNVEYAARGIPFIYSETNSDFDNKPYVYKIEHNDTEVDIRAIIDNFKFQIFEPLEIRMSVPHLSWDYQVQKIIESI